MPSLHGQPREPLGASSVPALFKRLARTPIRDVRRRTVEGCGLNQRRAAAPSMILAPSE